MKRCRVLARKALKINAPCKYKKCTFNGIWNGGGGDGQKNVYMSSSFYWTAREVEFTLVKIILIFNSLLIMQFFLHGFKAGILESDAVGGIIRPLDYMEAAKLVCATKFEDIKSNFPNTEDDDIPYLCMDLVYQYTLLVDGFGKLHFEYNIFMWRKV